MRLALILVAIAVAMSAATASAEPGKRKSSPEITVITGDAHAKRASFQQSPSGTDAQGNSFRTAGRSSNGICDRHAKVQEEILTKVPVSACASVTAAHLSDVTSLVVDYGSTAATVASGDFAGLESLRLLVLRGSGLTSIAAGSFDELTSLTRLYVERTSITTLPADVLDKLVKLTRLDLEYNEITTLPADLLAETAELTTIDLIGNNDYRNTFPIDAFDHMDDLTYLWIPLLPAPQLASAEVDGDSIMLTYDLPLKTAWRSPCPGAYPVTINGAEVAVSEVTTHRRAVELTLARAAQAGDSVTISYTIPDRTPGDPATYCHALWGLGAWYDENLGAHSQRAADFFNLEATNNSK